MTSIVTDFKSIRRKLERQDQKAEFEAKNPQPSEYERSCGVVVASLGSRPLSLKSLAHPAWPYTGTPFEWSKFVKVKI
jgi:hypothetical protein